ncbi:Short chain dehydrogenase [Giardia duodenalis]|uniref:Short chain dehydrogenase n=1 Tax=Giardia intestinalis TaxID=5741 RepID=V6U162_GIAIN|nr:Short chain dehydrogenase [Giardia intestinalis]
MTLESVPQDRCERCVREHIAVQAPGRSRLLRLSSRRAEVLLRAVCAMQRDCVHCCPVCPGASWHDCAYVCGRLAADMCKVLVAAEAGAVRKDGKTALILAAMADQETPRLRPAHRGHCSEGRRHRGTGQPASLGRSRRPERHRSNTHRGILEALPWQDAVSL